MGYHGVISTGSPTTKPAKKQTQHASLCEAEQIDCQLAGHIH